jgi:hypothetical protein
MDRRPAAERLAAAEREVELSRRRLAETHRNVVEPLRGQAAGNNFAQIIADSLLAGRRKGTRG